MFVHHFIYASPYIYNIYIGALSPELTYTPFRMLVYNHTVYVCMSTHFPTKTDVHPISYVGVQTYTVHQYINCHPF